MEVTAGATIVTVVVVETVSYDVGVGAVVVLAVTPMQLQALVYRWAPEQAVA